MGFLLDVWGEGRIVTSENMVTGFKEAVNLNHVNQRISNGPDTGRPIPNLVPVDNYDYPKFPDETYENITLMGAPITIGTAEEMCRVLQRPRGKIYLYDPFVSFRRTFEAIAFSRGMKLDGQYNVSDLSPPFNEVTLTTAYVYVWERDEL
jgi:hypothetical protein